MQPLNYNHLFYFHTVARSESLSQAARSLGITKPTISAQVRQLEDRLGHALFDRSGARLRLNEEGRAALRFTTQMFEAADELLAHFHGDRRNVPRKVRIGVGSEVARTLAADFFNPILQMEDVTLHLVSAPADVLRRRLAEFDIDILITDGVPPSSQDLGYQVTRVREEPLVIAGSTDGPGPGSTIAETLSERPLLQYHPEVDLHWRVRRWLDDLGVSPEVIAQSDDLPTLVALAAESDGVVFVPASALQDGEAPSLRHLHDAVGLTVENFAVLVEHETPDLLVDVVKRICRAA